MRSTVHETRFSPLTQLVRHRLLPAPGEVRGHVGDRVQADEVVAETAVAGSVRMIDLAADLNLSRRSVARHLRVSPGEIIAAGTPLAVVGLPGKRRQIAAPVAGTVADIHDGTLLIREEPQQIRLRAYVPGEISSRSILTAAYRSSPPGRWCGVSGAVAERARVCWR